MTRTYAVAERSAPAATPWPARKSKPSGACAQAKLAVGPSDDALEREADRAAEAVIDGRASSDSWRSASPWLVQRRCASCDEEDKKIQGKGAAPGPVGDRAASLLSSAVTSGKPLANSALAFFEPRFGHRFDRIRLHDDGRAAELSSQLGARAFTYGEHIFFGHGQLRGDHREGRRLLAHELAHTIQQGRAPALHGAPPVSPGPKKVRAQAQVALPARAATAQRPIDLANSALASPARALDPGLRGAMEARLGRSFSAVRVHDDHRANASARALGADAFTVGRDIVFGRPMSGFSGDRDRALLAHELVHTVQSGAARDGAPDARARDVTRHDAAEREADSLARSPHAAAPRQQVAPGTVLPAVQSVQAPFHDPNFCYRAGSPRDATHPDRTKVVAVMRAEIETPETCTGNIVLRTSVLESDWGAASAEFEAYGGGESQGLLDYLRRGDDRVDYEEEFHLDTCHANFNRCHLITYTEGNQKYIFAEARYRPRITATSEPTGDLLRDATPAPSLNVQPCDNLTPSGCR